MSANNPYIALLDEYLIQVDKGLSTCERMWTLNKDDKLEPWWNATVLALKSLKGDLIKLRHRMEGVNGVA